MTAFLLSILGFGKSAVSYGLQWLSRRSLAEIGCIALALACLFLVIANKAERRHSAKLQTQLTKCSQGRQADRDAYTKAQSDAAAQNKAHVAAENKLREQINEESHRDFISDRDRLRSQSGAPQGSAGGPGVPKVPKPAPGTPPEVVSLPPAELLRAQEAELQLNALIDWVLGQSSINPNER